MNITFIFSVNLLIFYIYNLRFIFTRYNFTNFGNLNTCIIWYSFYDSWFNWIGCKKGKKLTVLCRTDGQTYGRTETAGYRSASQKEGKQEKILLRKFVKKKKKKFLKEGWGMYEKYYHSVTNIYPCPSMLPPFYLS